MKKLFQIGAVFFGILMTQTGYAQNTNVNAPNQRASAAQQTLNPSAPNYTQQHNYGYGESSAEGRGYGYDRGYSNNGEACSNGACPADHACEDQACNDCWSLYCHYEPCYYNVKRCVEEQVPCKKRCCRMCPKYYEVTRCRYVPQYYTETICRQEPEYYDVDDCKTCKRWICERQCKYVPQYYWKHICGKQGCDTPCPR
jgi:hypothetical protein